jgi:hypothetical protein
MASIAVLITPSRVSVSYARDTEVGGCREYVLFEAPIWQECHQLFVHDNSMPRCLSKLVKIGKMIERRHVHNPTTMGFPSLSRSGRDMVLP